jgi:hypothetical protein
MNYLASNFTGISHTDLTGIITAIFVAAVLLLLLGAVAGIRRGAAKLDKNLGTTDESPKNFFKVFTGSRKNEAD